MSFPLKLEDDFRENAERTLNETATRNDTGYLRDWEDVQTDVRYNAKYVPDL